MDLQMRITGCCQAETTGADEDADDDTGDPAGLHLALQVALALLAGHPPVLRTGVAGVTAVDRLCLAAGHDVLCRNLKERKEKSCQSRCRF